MDQNSRGSYSRSYYFKERTDDVWTDKTIPDILYSHYLNQPNREALVFADTDGSKEVITYKELWVKANLLAQSFLSLGVKTSEFVAVSTRSCPEWVYVTFGAILAGARPINLSLTYTDGSDIVAMMKKLETCSAFVLDPGVDDANWKIISKIIDEYDKTGRVVSHQMPYLRYLICFDRSKNDHKAFTVSEMMTRKRSSVDLPRLNAEDIALLLQTSGSTGIPKAVAHTHRSLITGAVYFNERMSGRDHIQYNDRPFTWVGGFPFSVITGETRVLRSGFCAAPKDEVGFMIDVIKREHCNSITILPPGLKKLMRRQEEVGTDWPVEQIGTGGQPVVKSFVQCMGKLCKRFVCGYGSTEAIFICGVAVDRAQDFPDYAVGIPNDGIEIKITDERGEILPVNQRGEICIKSNALFKEYYNDSGRMNACFTPDGWYHTGDVGFMTQNGVFYCEGRLTDDIITGGKNVPPAILEALLETHKGVSRVICIPVPHEVMFQVICACVVVKEGFNVTEAQLRQFCEEIHNDKPGLFTALPTYYMFMSDFPVTSSGKVARKELTRLALERFCSSP